MGKGTDKLYITHSEWSSSDQYSASAGSNVNARAPAGSFKRLPFNFCSASLQPFQHPVCTASGTIFDLEVITDWINRHGTNPVDGTKLKLSDLIKLNFARNGDVDAGKAAGTDGEALGEMVDPVTYKVFTDNTHIVAIRHGSEANVFAFETVERLNIKAKMWQDLVDDREFTRKDIITLQDPQNVESRDLSKFKFLKDGDKVLSKTQEEERTGGSINVGALGRVGEKVLKAKEAVERARQARAEGGDVNKSNAIAKAKPMAPPQMHTQKKEAYNAAQYTTGQAAASFTSTGLTPNTSAARAILSDEEYMLKPKRVKTVGYARMATTHGSMTLELLPEFAPKAVWNFIQLSKRGYYKGVSFHRNIRNFMIQGGDPTGTGRGGQSCWGKNFEDEFEGPKSHDARGIISMANKGKNTNSSQFFILYRPAKHLDRKHTIFARVVEGLDVLDKLENGKVDEQYRPEEEVRIEDVVVYVDPFEEFQKQRKEKEEKANEEEEIRLAGGREDDRTTWTGKRIRGDGTVEDAEASTVGKYLDASLVGKGEAKTIDDAGLEEWREEPTKKKAKTAGGFGNFDNW